ncbi:MAG: hypothetical protein QOI62_2008, partial [Solirubrobacteraceae bacterium]|nr:hypothetical protein [Solirubrobacteraceae bacterium]
MLEAFSFVVLALGWIALPIIWFKFFHGR